MPNTKRVQDNERIERGDYEFAIDETPRAVGRMVPDQFLANPAGERLWILGGFGLTNPSAKQLRCDRGSAILSQKEKGQTITGILTFEGDTQKILDLAAFANGTYGVFIRYELQDGEFQNRIFWNPGSPGEEFTQSMATRRVANWGYTVATTAPSAEWFKIGEVVVSASPTLAVTGQRKFYFEGSEVAYGGLIADGKDNTGASAPGTYRTWGAGTNDRNANRALYGVRDLQTFSAAVREQMADIIGTGAGWYTAIPEGLAQKVSRSGDSTMAGNYLPDVTNTRALGSNLKRWDLFADLVDANDGNISGSLTVGDDISVSNIYPNEDGTRDLGYTGARWDAVYADRWDVGDTSPTNDIEIEGSGGGDRGRIHFFNTGAEATKYLNISYFQSSGIAAYDIGTGGTNTYHSFQVFGSNKLDIATTYVKVSADAIIDKRVDGIGTGANLTDAALLLWNESNTVGTEAASAVVPVLFRLGSTTANRDGFDLFAWRSADGAPQLTLRHVLNDVVQSGAAHVNFANGQTTFGQETEFKEEVRLATLTPSGSPSSTSSNGVDPRWIAAQSIVAAWATLEKGALESFGNDDIKRCHNFPGNIAVATFSGDNVVRFSLSTVMQNNDYAVTVTGQGVETNEDALRLFKVVNQTTSAFDVLIYAWNGVTDVWDYLDPASAGSRSFTMNVIVVGDIL